MTQEGTRSKGPSRREKKRFVGREPKRKYCVRNLSHFQSSEASIVDAEGVLNRREGVKADSRALGKNI